MPANLCVNIETLLPSNEAKNHYKTFMPNIEFNELIEVLNCGYGMLIIISNEDQFLLEHVMQNQNIDFEYFGKVCNNSNDKQSIHIDNKFKNY